jgi:hypothetical protein
MSTQKGPPPDQKKSDRPSTLPSRQPSRPWEDPCIADKKRKERERKIGKLLRPYVDNWSDIGFWEPSSEAGDPAGYGEDERRLVKKGKGKVVGKAVGKGGKGGRKGVRFG